MDGATGDRAGFGFVEMTMAEDANAAVRRLGPNSMAARSNRGGKAVRRWRPLPRQGWGGHGRLERRPQILTGELHVPLPVERRP
jgi:hypothetical protein